MQSAPENAQTSKYNKVIAEVLLFSDVPLCNETVSMYMDKRNKNNFKLFSMIKFIISLQEKGQIR